MLVVIDNFRTLGSLRMPLTNIVKTVRAKAPARIDLAGGTIDLWPLNVFFENAATINATINQFAEVEVAIGAESKIGETSSFTLESRDRNERVEFSSYGQLLESFQFTHKAVDLNPSLWLHARVVRQFFAFWRKNANFHLSTRCDSPAGAGLGGSSALNIALCNAFRSITNANFTDEELIGLARDLETTVIEVPAGVQDYWSAQFGGIQAIHFEPGKTYRRVFYKQKTFVESQILLLYSGQSRNSGINNWAVYKAFIDKDPTVVAAFKNIVKATHQVEESLDRFSESTFIEGIKREWAARQQLAPGIATKEMLQVMDEAYNLGAVAAKVCGAGGGGCFLIVVPPEQKASIQARLKDKLIGTSIRLIDFEIAESGCVVTET